MKFTVTKDLILIEDVFWITYMGNSVSKIDIKSYSLNFKKEKWKNYFYIYTNTDRTCLSSYRWDCKEIIDQVIIELQLIWVETILCCVDWIWTIWNYYWDLKVLEVVWRYYRSIEDHSSCQWQEITKDLYDSLLSFNKLKISKIKPKDLNFI